MPTAKWILDARKAKAKKKKAKEQLENPHLPNWYKRRLEEASATTARKKKSHGRQ